MRLPLTPLTFLSVLLLASGCTDFFERELELVDLPYERQLVLNTVLSPQDSLIRAEVYLTAPTIGELPPDYPRNGRVDDAIVKLEGPEGTFTFTSQRGYRYPTYVLLQAEVDLEAGQTYQVIAEWDGLTARGQTTIPELSIPRNFIELENVSNNQERRTRATWPNQAGEQDYYLVFTDQVFRTQRDDIERELIDFIHGRDALGPRITGGFFGGRRGSGYKKTVSVCRTTRATYDYLLTRGTLQVNDENPFTEPTTVANSLEEGLGLVGAASCWRIEL